MDYFALFGLPRRPALDDLQLKERYFALASEHHPDSADGDAGVFSDIQEGLKVLRDPATRLRHLVELSFPEGPAVGSPGTSGDLFMQIGGALQGAKSVFARRSAATSSLGKAVLAGEVVASLRAMTDARTNIEAARQALLGRMQELDAVWPAVEPEGLRALAAEFAFIGRWREELAEWEFKLAQD